MRKMHIRECAKRVSRWILLLSSHHQIVQVPEGEIIRMLRVEAAIFNKIYTTHSNYRQVVLSGTLDFLLVFTLDGLRGLGSSYKKMFLVAPFEKSPKFMIFHQILYSEFTRLIENIFR